MAFSFDFPSKANMPASVSGVNKAVADLILKASYW